MTHRIQTHHIGGAKCTGLGATQFGTGQVIDHIDRQAELFRFVHRRQHAENTDAVGDEIRRIDCPYDALAQRGGQKAFELIENDRLGRRSRNQFDQMHVTRRIKKMYAAKTRLQFGIEAIGQCSNR